MDIPKIWYTLGEYGGFAGMLYSYFTGNDTLFTVSTIACFYGNQSLKNKEVDKRISKLEKQME